jgi:hypothetical protein
MNNYQSARQASHKLIVMEAKNYPDEVSLIPQFATGINRLEEITDEVDTIVIQQAKDITGVAGDKYVIMDELIDYVVDVAGAIHSYAVLKGDKTLQAKVNYKESTLAKMAQADLITSAGIILEEAGKLTPADLATEGITPEEITAFSDIYTQLKKVSSNTRGAIIDRKGYTQKLSDLFDEAAGLKKNTLDRLASQFKRKSPEFYQKYKAAATVIYKRSPKTPPAAEVK